MASVVTGRPDPVSWLPLLKLRLKDPREDQEQSRDPFTNWRQAPGSHHRGHEKNPGAVPDRRRIRCPQGCHDPSGAAAVELNVWRLGVRGRGSVMRLMRVSLALPTAVCLLSGPARTAPPPTEAGPVPRDVGELVRKLGSPSYAEREAAQAALARLGRGAQAC